MKKIFLTHQFKNIFISEIKDCLAHDDYQKINIEFDYFKYKVFAEIIAFSKRYSEDCDKGYTSYAENTLESFSIESLEIYNEDTMLNLDYSEIIFHLEF